MIGPSRAHLLGALAVAWGAISVMAQHGHEEATCYSSNKIIVKSRASMFIEMDAAVGRLSPSSAPSGTVSHDHPRLAAHSAPRSRADAVMLEVLARTRSRGGKCDDATGVAGCTLIIRNGEKCAFCRKGASDLCVTCAASADLIKSGYMCTPDCAPGPKPLKSVGGGEIPPPKVPKGATYGADQVCASLVAYLNARSANYLKREEAVTRFVDDCQEHLGPICREECVHLSTLITRMHESAWEAFAGRRGNPLTLSPYTSFGPVDFPIKPPDKAYEKAAREFVQTALTTEDCVKCLRLGDCYPTCLSLGTCGGEFDAVNDHPS